VRTDFNIAATALERVKRVSKAEGKPVGAPASESLAQELAARQESQAALARRWIGRPMGTRCELADKDAVLDALDEGQ